jgi:outer membrane protein
MTTQTTLKIKHNKLLLTAAIAAAVFASMPVQALEAGDILARARYININPHVNNGNELTSSSTGAPLAGGGLGVDIKSKATLDIDFTYMVTNNFGVELLLDVPTKHDVNVVNNNGQTVADAGDVHVLPPALIAQWHFDPSGHVRPYIGAGINYTFIYDEGTGASLDNALGGNTTLSVDDTWGAVAQIGMDVDIDKTWFLNLDAKYIQMNSKGTVKVNGVKTADANFDINPLVIGVGIGMKF